MKKYILIALLIFPTFHTWAQSITVQGTVTDASDKTTLPYVNVYIKNTSQGTYTDVNGNFTIRVPNPGAVIVFSFIGYEKQEVRVTENISLNVKLKPLTYDIEEVVVLPGENPADVIMRQVNDKRKVHDPENLNTFQFKTYNKFIVGVHRELDTSKYKIVKNDSLKDDIDDLLSNKMNLFLMESVTEKLYRKPGKYKETVMASRMSGIKNAEYALLATEIQSFSFYKNYIKIMGKEYLSPIADGNTRKYLFILQDTVEENGESAYTIYYQPRKGKNFEGLTGLLYINTQNFAVLKATANLADQGGLNVQVVQEYAKMGEDTYFPTYFTGDFIFGGAQVSFADSTGPYKSVEPIGKAKTTLYDIKLNDFIAKKEFDNVELDFAPDATKKDSAFWSKHRTEQLDSRDSFTYHFIDSIGDELKLDRRLEFLRIAQTGRLPIGVINVHLWDVLRFNNFEGFRPGLHLSTNDRLSRRFSIGGYYAYGFKDVHSKYGGNAELYFNKSKSSAFEVSYSNDVSETGVHALGQFDTEMEERLRRYYISIMDRVERSKANLKFRLFRYVTAETGIEQVNKLATTQYRFDDGQQQYFKFTNAVVSLRWAPGEKLIRSFGRYRAKESKWPVVYANITKGFNNLMDGQFGFLRTDLMAEYDFRVRHLGHSYIRVAAGDVQGSVPYTEMYFGKAGYNAKNLAVVTPWAFETMRYNEFFGNRYAALFFRHDFGSLLFKYKKFKPELLLVTNVYFSSFTNNGEHKNFPLAAADKGFYESGIQINNIFIHNFSGYGIGVFYRYGPYSDAEPLKNFAIKLSLTPSFGF